MESKQGGRRVGVMKYVHWVIDDSPWLIRLPARIVLVCVLSLVFVITKLVLTGKQWNRFDEWMRRL